jgi:DNA-binding NarL/FixJ family response regulator
LKITGLLGVKSASNSRLAQMIRREPDLTVCGEAEDAPSALQMIYALRPDILIVDISLHGPDGLDLLKSVRAKDAALPVLILSMHDESIYAERCLRAGANGYIMKQEATENVLVALRRILNHEVYVSPRIANKMLQRFVSAGAAHGQHSSVDALSDRELEVLRLIGEGLNAGVLEDGCLTHPEDGAREGADFIKHHIIRVTEKAFDDFAGGTIEKKQIERALGLR